MEKLTKKQRNICIGLCIILFIIGFICGIATGLTRVNRKENTLNYANNTNNTDNENKNVIENVSNSIQDTSLNKTSNTTTNTNVISNKEYSDLKAKVEKDEADYGDNYQKFTYCKNTYKKEPDRIYFKSSKKDGFYLFEKNDENYNHLLEVSEDRMHYSSIEDYNLYCFTPDSISIMMTSGDNYIIFDYDNGDLSETDSNFNKDLIFRFSENTRLYRLATYLSCYKELISRENLDKKEFATDTSISGFKYMMYNDYSD